MEIKNPCRAEARSRASFLEDFTEGVRYAFQQPLTRSIIALALFHCALTMAFESLLPAYARQQFTGEAIGFGSLLTAIGAGALVASLMVGGIQGPLARGRLFFIMGILSGAGQVMLAFAPFMAFAIIAAVIMGAASATFMTITQAITQSLAADEFRGRVASLVTFTIGGAMAVMNLANGLFASNFDASSILLIDGVIFTAIMVISIMAMTPRRVYTRGIPAEAHAT